jgi:hypothetical protein
VSKPTTSSIPASFGSAMLNRASAASPTTELLRVVAVSGVEPERPALWEPPASDAHSDSGGRTCAS